MSGKLIWITGLAGSGKTTLAEKVCSTLKESGKNPIHLDGDMVRSILGNAHTHSSTDRKEVATIYCRLAHQLVKQGATVIFSTMSLFHDIHSFNRSELDEQYVEVLLNVTTDELKRRNKKGLYQGENTNVVGRDQQPEYPKNPDLELDNNHSAELDANVSRIVTFLSKQ